MDTKELLTRAIYNTVRKVGTEDGRTLDNELVCAYLLGSRYVGLDVTGSDYDFVVITNPTKDNFYDGTKGEVRKCTVVEEHTVEISYIDIRTFVAWVSQGKLLAQQILCAEKQDMFLCHNLPNSKISSSTMDLALFLLFLNTNRANFMLLDPYRLMSEIVGRMRSHKKRADGALTKESRMKHLLEIAYLDQIAHEIVSGSHPVSHVIKLPENLRNTYRDMRNNPQEHQILDFNAYAEEAIETYKGLEEKDFKVKSPSNYDEQCRVLRKTVENIFLNRGVASKDGSTNRE